MTLEQLRIFVAVAERQHMTRAAQALNITQSAASAAIAALEARHDARLFDRVGRGLTLSEAGRAFLPEARAVLARAADAERLLDDLAGLAQRQAAADAVEQLRVVPRLQRRDRCAGRRLSDVQRLRRAGHVLALGHRHEDAQLLQGHGDMI